jgi:hypothetical protein
LVSYHIATWYHNPEDNTHLHCLEALYKSAWIAVSSSVWLVTYLLS